MFDFFAEQLDEDDVLLRAERVVQDAENDQIHFFDLVARENRVDVAFHAGLHLAEREKSRARRPLLLSENLVEAERREMWEAISGGPRASEVHDTCRISGKQIAPC